jgi:flavin reductase (DIM6/NTAB) family NADH-FMN oxidoreductase RutF
MDDNARKTALRITPYVLHVISAEGQDSLITAGTLNWITHASFRPPRFALEVKADSQIHDITKPGRYFALNVLGKGQQGATYTIFKPAERYCQRFSGESFHSASTVAPVQGNNPPFVECRLLTTVEEEEHSIFIGEVVDVGLNQEPEERAGDVTLLLNDLDEKTFFSRCMDFIL